MAFDVKAYMKEYNAKHREERKKYYQEHKEEIKEKRKIYYQENKEKVKIMQKNWVKNNKAHFIELCHKSRRNRAEKLKAQGCTNTWCVINNGAEPKYKTKENND